MFWIYSFFVSFVVLCLPIVGLFSKKIHQFLQKRKAPHLLIKNQIFSPDKQLIWFHCASLGEFELCKPLLKTIKSNHPNFNLLLTFFSPSGIQTSSDFDLVDHIGFLPFDTKGRVRRFLDKTNPDIAIFVKYEFWPNYLNQLHEREIKTFAISCQFSKNHFLFQWYGRWLLNELKKMTHLFVQNQSSFVLLNRYQFNNISVSGDLRIDRVIENASQPFYSEIIEKFLNRKPCFIAGSTWEKDIELLFPEIESIYDKIIIASHDIDLKSIAFIKSKISTSYQVISRSDIDTIEKTQILIIDSIGLLSSIYRFAQITYVGGGFSKKGLHNILEPIGHCKPVLFGPHYHYFPEASDLIHKHIAFSVSDKSQFRQTSQHLKANPKLLASIQKEIREYLNKNKNGSKKVFKHISTHLNPEFLIKITNVLLLLI